MYEAGTTYTYSRCVEQCAAEYAIQQCNCTDAYMPGKMRPPGLILGLRPANKRRRYFVTTSLIGRAQA